MTALFSALGCLFLVATSAAPAAPAQETRSLQGGDNRVWTQNPHMHRMWERLGLACAQGCAKADAAAFERDAIAEMRLMAPAVGMTPDQMAEHIKAIPRQLLTIGQDDPAILTDYDKFIVALVGPP